MSSYDNMQDRIDEYIRGNMSDSERLLFEEELKQDDSLRKEYELNIAITEGIQAAKLKETLEKLEVAIRGESNKSSSRILLYKLSSLAASVIIVLSLGFSFMHASRTKTVGAGCYADLVAPISRSSNEVDSLIAVAYDLIGASKQKEALDVLTSTRELVSQELEKSIVDEETEYNHQMAQLRLYDVDWYEAIATMRQGKYRLAKKQLKEIAASQSPYADKSKHILKEIFNVK